MILKLLFVCCWKSPEGRTTFIPPYGTSTNLRVTSRTKTREVIKMLMTKFQVWLLLFPIFSHILCFVICLLVGEVHYNFLGPWLGTPKRQLMELLQQSSYSTVILLRLVHLVPQKGLFWQYKKIHYECHCLFLVHYTCNFGCFLP